MKSSKQHPRVVAMVAAAPGWRCAYRDDGQLLEEPIIAWAAVELEAGYIEVRAVEARAATPPAEVWNTCEMAEDNSNFSGYLAPGEEAGKFSPTSPKTELKQAA